MKWLKLAVAVSVGLFVAIQFVPYGRNHTNPPVIAEPAWDSTATRDLAVRACFDCHSNETKWLWYSNIAPISWFIQNEVDEGRVELNFSEWNRPQEGEEAAGSVREGEMPPRLYGLLRARLSGEELDALAAGLAATLGDEHDGDSEEHDGDDD